jgi:Late embryogenesis abundant protein.
VALSGVSAGRRFFTLSGRMGTKRPILTLIQQTNEQGRPDMIQLLFGAILGAGTALLFAPSTGAGTRAKLKEGGKRLQYRLEQLKDYADDKKQVLAHKLLGFQHDLECVKDKAQEKAGEFKDIAQEKAEEFKDKAQEKAEELKAKSEELKTKATEVKDKAVEFKEHAAEKAAELKSAASEDIKELAEKADAFKEKAAQNAEVLKNDLGELKKDFVEAIQDFRTPTDSGNTKASQSEKKSDFPPKPPTTRTSGGAF